MQKAEIRLRNLRGFANAMHAIRLRNFQEFRKRHGQNLVLLLRPIIYIFCIALKISTLVH